MVAISEIREIDIRVKTTGVEQAATATNKLASAEEQVVQSTEKFERSTSSLTRALERHQTALDREYASTQGLRKVTDDLAAARARDLISVERHNKLMELAGARYGGVGAMATKAGAGTKLAAHEMTNLSAQISDIGVSLAGGQSPFMVMIQQGSQIQGILGDRGLKGGVAALGAGLLSFATNPLTLATLGVAGLAAGVSYLASSGETAIDKLDEAFRKHEETVKNIKTAYGAAAQGLTDYADPSRVSVRADAYSNRLALQATARSQASDFLGDVVRPGGWSFAPDFSDPLEMIKKQYRPLAAEIEKFQATARAGVPDFRALRDATAELYLANPGDSGLAKLWTDLSKATEAGLKAQNALQPLTKTLGNLNEISRATAPAFDLIASKLPNIGEPIRVATEKATDALAKYEAAGRAMQGTPLEQALAREKNAFDELSKSIAGTRGQTDALSRARAAYDQRTAAVRSQFNDEGTKGQTAFERTMERTQDRIRLQQAEAATFGMTRSAAEAYRTEIELINAATEKGKSLTATQLVQLKAAADPLVERDVAKHPHALKDVVLDFNLEALP